MSRMAHFAQGAANSSPAETASLQARADVVNNANPHGYHANGLNQQVMLSPGNGNSKADASRQTPNGQLPSGNGMSNSTYQQINPTSYGTNLGI
jgi:hypothetical protein